MAKKRFKIKDKQGNPVDYDISAASITIDVEGKSLDVKLSELVDAIARSVKSVTFNGNSPTMDSNGNVNLGQQVQGDWTEANINWPSYIKNKPSFSRVATTGSYNDLTDKPTIPEGVQADSQMSDSSDAPVKNRVIKAYVDNLISGLINGAPQALDTLKELSAALGNDADFAATIAQQLANKANAADVYTKNDVDGLVANAGKVKSVTINGQKKLPNETNGDIDLDTILQGPQGPQGPQGDSGYTGAANELRVANTLDDDDPTAAISAACAHDLKVQAFVKKGTFAQAYAKANENNVVFPWMLDDEDSQGNTITKMIWHVGDLQFVDAIGAKIVGNNSGAIDGMIVTATKNGVMRMYKDANTYRDLDLHVDDNPFEFDDLLIDANDSYADPDAPSREKVIFGVYATAGDPSSFTKDDTVVTDVDFGGLLLNGEELFSQNTTIKTIKGLRVTTAYNICYRCTALEELEISGGASDNIISSRKFISNCSNLSKVLAAGLYGNEIDGGYGAMEIADLRNITMTITGKNLFGFSNSIGTLILGSGIDLEQEAGSWFTSSGSASVTKLVYMNNNSNVPILAINGVNVGFLNNKVGTIYVPSVLKTAYQNAWLQVTTPIKGYTIVDGEIVFEE